MPPLPRALPLRRSRTGNAPDEEAPHNTVALAEDCAWIVRDARVLLEQQTGPRWRGLWKLPALPTRPRDTELLLALEYPFTHHRVTLSVFADSPPLTMGENQRWFAADALEAAALPSPHRRAVKRLLAG